MHGIEHLNEFMMLGRIKKQMRTQLRPQRGLLSNPISGKCARFNYRMALEHIYLGTNILNLFYYNTKM